MKKTILIFTLIICSFLIVSCKADKTNEFKEADEFITPYKIVNETNDFKSHIVDSANNPVILLSSELRLDILMTADNVLDTELEEYFKIAKLTGLNTLDLPIMWSMFETEEDKYDFTKINYLLSLAKKEDLKLNLLWYGTFVDGESKSAYYPKYISDDNTKYPVMLDLYDFANFGRVKLLDWSSTELIKREQLALYNLMNNIYDWTKENDNYHAVVNVQVGQGLDRFPRWRVSQYDFVDENGVLFANEKAWEMVYNYADKISMAVKYSKYRALTRVDFTEQNAVVNYVTKTYDLEYIDIVSPTYLHLVANSKSGIRNFSESFPNMPVINAQNWADDQNHRNLLASFGLGATGFVSYQLSAARYFPEPPNGALFKRYNEDGGSIEEKFEQNNTRVDDLKPVISGLTKAYPEVAKAKRKNFAILGMDTRLEYDKQQNIYLDKGLMFEYSNPRDGLGFIIHSDNYVYVYTTKDSKITFSNVSFVNSSKGHFDIRGTWVNEGNIELGNNNLSIQTEGNNLYRIRINSMNELPTNIPESYSSILDAIRG